MGSSNLDEDLEIACEVMMEDGFKPELKQSFNFYQSSPRGGSRNSSCSTEFELGECGRHPQSYTENPEVAVFVDEQEIQDLRRYSTTCEDQTHQVPNLTYNAWDDQFDNTCLFWDDTDCSDVSEMPRMQSRERYPVIKTEFRSNCEVPDITKQMDTVLNLNQDTSQDLHVNFLNLKRLYHIKDVKPSIQTEYIEDSEVYIFLKASLKIQQVKVYLKELQNAATASKGTLELQASFDENKGLLIVDLNFLSSWLVADHTEWQMYVVTQFEDGNSQCCYSAPFQMRTSSSSHRFVDSSSCYHLHGIQMDTHTDQSLACTTTSSAPLHFGHEDSVSFGERTPQKPSIQLLPGSKLTLNSIRFELGKEEDVVFIQEQPEFSGLLKLVKRNTSRDPMGRRRANGFRSAEETFSWVCGHCFFRRLKKSTVKSHVSRKVCLRNRRIFAESQLLKGQRRPVIRRSNTFPIALPRRSFDDETFSSKTP